MSVIIETRNGRRLRINKINVTDLKEYIDRSNPKWIISENIAIRTEEIISIEEESV